MKYLAWHDRVLPPYYQSSPTIKTVRLNSNTNTPSLTSSHLPSAVPPWVDQKHHNTYTVLVLRSIVKDKQDSQRISLGVCGTVHVIHTGDPALTSVRWQIHNELTSVKCFWNPGRYPGTKPTRPRIALPIEIIGEHINKLVLSSFQAKYVIHARNSIST